MAKARKAGSAATYARRLVDDAYVQEQLTDAAARLRAAYARASRKRGKAAEDKKLYEHLRQAAGSIRKAILALRRRRPEPKRRGRKLVVVALAAGGAAAVLTKRGRGKLQAAVSSEASPSGEGPTPAPPAPTAVRTG
jgi:hypothetical protein